METVQNVKSKYPHIEWMDISANGVLTECAIMQKKPNGDVAFFQVDTLDAIDKQRLVKIISHRHANDHSLWDLMKQITLNNGVNALDYFHQLVKIRTPGGTVISPRDGRIGAAIVPPTAPTAPSMKTEKKDIKK